LETEKTMLTDVQIDTTLKTTFANDEVAKRYLDAAQRRTLLMMSTVPPRILLGVCDHFRM